MSSNNARADSLSLLLFTLRSGKLLAINLLKVSEIIPCPPLTKMPESHPNVKGIAVLRGTALSVIDLSRAIGEQPLLDPDGGCLIVTDVSRSKQGLHVQAVSKIVHCLSTDIRPPPYGSGKRSYITGVTQVDGVLVQVLDIEKVIHGIAPAKVEAADVTGHDAAEVAKAYFAVGSALELPWYLQQISDLPVANNWQAQAREAFRDDVDWQQRAITISVLQMADAPEDMEARVALWLEQHKDMADRWVAMMVEIRAAVGTDYAMYAVANRELLDLATGAGSLILSHVNDAGFWLLKQYFNMNVAESFKTWTAMETILSIVGLIFILLLSLVV